jgi:GNAT superfamily N-acetyltransferase
MVKQGLFIESLTTDHAKDWYAELEAMYVSSFEPAERVLFSLLWDSQQRPPNNEFLPEMVGLMEGGKPVGGAWYGYMPDVNLGYLGYLFIHPRKRGSGYGTILCQHVFSAIAQRALKISQKLPRFTSWEVRIPEEASSEEERQRRFKRLRFYERLGAAPVHVFYPCPPIGEGQPALNFLPMAITYPPGRELSEEDRVDLVYYGLVRMCGLDPHSPDLKLAIESARRRMK